MVGLLTKLQSKTVRATQSNYTFVMGNEEVGVDTVLKVDALGDDREEGREREGGREGAADV